MLSSCQRTKPPSEAQAPAGPRTYQSREPCQKLYGLFFFALRAVPMDSLRLREGEGRAKVGARLCRAGTRVHQPT